jgi:putative PEP-CTERM system histidine kinase
VLHDQLVGLVQLQRPVAPIVVDWEVRDILKTAGRQIAGYLAVRQAVEKLVQARQFDSFNRMSAFVVHDLKNLVAQLALLLKNAARHRANPEFQRDMLETVENVLDRMQGLLMQLRVGTRPIEQAAPLPLGDMLRSAIAAKKGLRLEPALDIADSAEHAEIVAHRDRLERVVGHLLQNAVEATPPEGAVRVAARRDGRHAVIEVIDTGRGMSREFIDTRLFKPFTSTKEHGMGIGAFESRDYVREIGGTLAVTSIEGRGTTFTLRLPIHGAAALPSREA